MSSNVNPARGPRHEAPGFFHDSAFLLPERNYDRLLCEGNHPLHPTRSDGMLVGKLRTAGATERLSAVEGQ